MRIQTILMGLALAGCAIETDTETDTDTDDVETSETESAATVTQWNSFRTTVNGYPQRSEYQVGLAGYNGRLYMVHSGHSDPYELWQATYTSSGWSSDFRLPWRSKGGPSLTVHGSTLKMVYRSTEYPKNQLKLSTFVNGAFQQPVTIGSSLGNEALVSEPSTTTFAGQHYVAYCTNGATRVDRQEGTGWANVLWMPMTGCADVELAVIPDTGQLHLVYALANGFMYETRTSTGNVYGWTSSAYLPYKKTAQPISIVTCNGVTHMVHGGHDSPTQVWWSERRSGQWSNDFQVGQEQSYGGAAVGCYPSSIPQAVMVHNSTDNSLNYSTFRQ